MSEQPKLVFDDEPQIVSGMPFTMPFTMPHTRVLNPDSKVKRLVFSNVQPVLVFENVERKSVFDVLQRAADGDFNNDFNTDFS